MSIIKTYYFEIIITLPFAPSPLIYSLSSFTLLICGIYRKGASKDAPSDPIPYFIILK